MCYILGTSLFIYWLRPRAPNPAGQSSIPGQGTSSYMPQIKTLKILCAVIKTWHSQINKLKKKKRILHSYFGDIAVSETEKVLVL